MAIKMVMVFVARYNVALYYWNGFFLYYSVRCGILYYTISMYFRSFFDDAFFMHIENHFLQYDTYRYYTILYRLFYI